LGVVVFVFGGSCYNHEKTERVKAGRVFGETFNKFYLHIVDIFLGIDN
jgi:hypothetical protein